jgi:hypothetical protein
MRNKKRRVASGMFYFGTLLSAKAHQYFREHAKFPSKRLTGSATRETLLHVPRHAMYICVCQLCVACILEARATRLLESQYVIEVSHLPLLFVRLAAL